MTDTPGTAAVPDDLSTLGPVVINPSAIGNPDETPRLYVGLELAALLNPCNGNAPSRPDNYCGGVNGHHAQDCEGRR